MPLRSRLMSLFLWAAVTGWGIGLGAKLFDLVVLAGAWGAAPPGSLSLMPYGARYPVDPGDFFLPLSAVMLVASVGALVAGWHSPRELRVRLLVPVIAFALIWAVAPTVFWPMIRDLYGAASGRVESSDAQLVRLVRRWFVWDWARVAVIAVGFASSVRAIGLSGLQRHASGGGGSRIRGDA